MNEAVASHKGNVQLPQFNDMCPDLPKMPQKLLHHCLLGGPYGETSKSMASFIKISRQAATETAPEPAVTKSKAGD